jgi:hypothetical protein
MWYSNLEKHLFLDISSTNIDTLVPSLYQCVKTRSIEVFWLLSQTFPHVRFKLFIHQWNVCHLSLWISFAVCPFSTKKHNKTLLLGSILTKHHRHFDYWNQPLKMRMRVCYLVIHIENLLHQLQLFYFHLRPIYWLSLVYWKYRQCS